LAISKHNDRREQIELKQLHLEFIEGCVILGAFVLVTITAATATIVCVLKGYAWPTPSITSVASTTALVVGGRRARHRRDP